MAMVSVTFGGQKVGEYSLDKQVTVVGRDPSCEIHIDNLGVSRTHCQFIRRGNAYVLQDMNSQNGTYVNGKRIGEHFLNDGDEILVGKYTLTFSAQGVAASAPSVPAQKDDLVSDALRTYVMDGAKIRERLSEMRASSPGEPPAAQPAPPMPAGVPSAGAAAGPSGSGPRRAIDHAIDFDPLRPRRPLTATLPRPSAPSGGGMKTVLYLSVAINLVLIGLVAALIVFLLRFAARVGPPQAPASPVPAAEPAQAPAAGPAAQ